MMSIRWIVVRLFDEITAHPRRNGTIMKYLLLVYSAESAWTEQSRAQCMADSTTLCDELAS
jgi:hypothetical protein